MRNWDRTVAEVLVVQPQEVKTEVDGLRGMEEEGTVPIAVLGHCEVAVADTVADTELGLGNRPGHS